MKKICLCICLCVLLLAFAGCGDTAPVSTEKTTEKTTSAVSETSESTDQNPEAVIDLPNTFSEKEVQGVGTQIRKTETYRITPVSVACSTAGGNRISISYPAITVSGNPAFSDQLTNELCGFLTQNLSKGQLQNAVGVTEFDCGYTILYADDTRFSVLCYIREAVYNGGRPVSNYMGVTVDAVEMRKLTLADLGVSTDGIPDASGTAYLEIYTAIGNAEKIRASLRDALQEVKDPATYTNFCLGADGLYLMVPMRDVLTSLQTGIVKLDSVRALPVQLPEATFIAWTKHQDIYYGLTDDFRIFYASSDLPTRSEEWEDSYMNDYGECRVYRYMWPMERLDGFAAVFKGDTCVLFDYFNLLDCRENIFRLGSTVYNASAEPIAESDDISITADEYILYRLENGTTYHLTNAAGESLYTSPADVRAICTTRDGVLCEKNGTYFMADRYGKTVAEFGKWDDASMRFCNMWEDYYSQENPLYCFRFCSETGENELCLTYVPATGETGIRK